MNHVEYLYRALSPRWSFAPLSGEGAAINGGRYNRARIPALYLAADHVTALVEYQRRAAFRPSTVAAYRLRDARLADLIDPTRRQELGADEQDMKAAWRLDASLGKIPPSWLIADRLRQDSYHGLRFRSALNGGPCVVLWRWNEQDGPRLEVVDPDGDLPRDNRSWS